MKRQSIMKKEDKTSRTSKKRKVSKNVKDAFDEVPGIGSVWTRWYDAPYKFLRWLMTNGTLPWSVRAKANKGVNYLLQFNTHDRNKAWSREDPLHNLIVPSDEHVIVPSIWVVELFSPNEIPKLERTIVKNGWDKNRYGSIDGAGNVEMLNRSRAGRGYLWWWLARIINFDETKWLIPDAKRGKLPPQFSTVKLKAIQVESSLTAVIGQFTLTEKAAESLDKIWHDSHEPILVRENGKLRPQDRQFSSYRIIQNHRRTLHDEARGWMSRRCPGFFATNNEPQFVVDIMLTDKYDPTLGKEPDRDFLDALRALGVDGVNIQRHTTKELPKMLFMAADNLYPNILDRNRTWSLIGNERKVAAAHENFKYQGGDTRFGSVHYADEYMSKTILMLTVTELLSVLEDRYAALRDKAKLQHGVFRVRRLKNLNESFLNLSLTLSSLRHNLKKLGEEGWKRVEGADFSTEYAPHVIKHNKKLSKEPRNMSKDIQAYQLKKLQDLTDADADYRDILSTVASLGVSASNIRLVRWSLIVATLSLLISFIVLTVRTNAN
jgi:hypothetical protein